MIPPAARWLLALAGACLGEDRRDWAVAMEAEVAAAAADGHALGFAAGCLMAAVRTLPERAEGRLTLARYALALGLILPVAALLATGALHGFPYIDTAQADGRGLLGDGGASVLLLNAGNRAAAAALTLLMLCLAMSQLLAGWALVDRRWSGLGVAARLGAATAVTLVIVHATLGLDERRLFLPLSIMLVEGALVWAVADRVMGRSPEPRRR